MWKVYNLYSALPIGTPFAVSLAVGCALFRLYPNAPRIKTQRIINKVVVIGSALVILLYLICTASYLYIPVYHDHVEPTVAVSTTLLLRGEQIYPALESHDRLYGIIYGPFLYFIHAGFIFFLHNIASTKISAILAIWAALIYVGLETKRLSSSLYTTLPILGCTIIFLDRFGVEAFWDRPEPFLLLLNALAIRSIRFTRVNVIVSLGILAGISINLKVYSGVTFIPLVAMLMLRGKTFKEGLVIGGSIGLLTLVVAMVPFLCPNVSLHGYISYLGITARHGFSVATFGENLEYVGLLLAPIALIYAIRRPSLTVELRGAVLALIISIFLLAFMGSKNGAGRAYLLPALPVTLYLTILVAVSPARRNDPQINGRAGAMYFFILYLIGIGPYAVPYISRINQLIGHAQVIRPQIAELTEVFTAYPDAEMGATDYANYAATFYRVIGILQGTPVHLEIPYLIDLRSAGVDIAVTEGLVADCLVPEWVLPARGIPFSIKAGNVLELFSEQFRRDFLDKYRIVFQGQYYDVWSCPASKSRRMT